MRSEAQGKKFSIKTSNFDGAGGGGYGVITASDLMVVLAAINPPPLQYAHMMTYHQHWPRHLLESMVFEDMRKRVKSQKTIRHEYLAKNHGSLFNAARDLSIGIADYLARHKIKNEHLSQRFDIEKSKFSRYYREFVADCIADYEHEFGKLERKIHEMTKDD